MQHRNDTLQDGDTQRSHFFGVKIRLGLPFKLLLAFLIVALLPLGLIQYFNVRAVRSSLETEAFKTLHASASHTALRLDAFIASNLDIIATEAQLPALVDFLSLPREEQTRPIHEQRLLDILKSFSRKNRVFISSYALIDMSGRNVLDIDHSNIGTNLAGRSYYLEALETGLPVVSNVEFDQQSGEAYLYFSSPIHNEQGQPVGVLRARYSAAILQQLIIQDTGLVGPRSFAMLINEKRLILGYGVFSHGGATDLVFNSITPLTAESISELKSLRLLPPLPREEIVTPLPRLDQALSLADSPDPHFTMRLPSTGETLQAAAMARMQSRPWTVTFFQPRDAFLAPAREQSRRAFVLVLIIAACASAVAFAWAFYLSRPIQRLTVTAGRIADGDLSAQAPVQTRDEIGALANAFNRMTDRLRHRIEMEALISRMSRKFINLDAGGTDKAVDQALEEIGQFANADRCFLFKVSPDGMAAHNTNDWSRQGVPSLAGEDLNYEDLPGLLNFLKSKEQIRLPDLRAGGSGPEVRFWEDRDARSVLCVSMVLGQRMIGFLGFETVNAPMQWPHEDTHLLRMTGEIISSTLERQRVEKDKDRIEEQLRQSMKMEAVGTLAGGIAHDFNNLLQAISGNIQLLLTKKQTDDPDQKYLDDMLRATERATFLVQRLLTFSRKMEGRMVEVDLNEVVHNTLALLERTIPKMVVIEQELAPDLHHVFADPTQMEQILLNLVSNSADAMPEGGTVHIKTKNISLGCDRFDSYPEFAPGEYILLKVSDTGVGMSEDILEHIFDPFFTTKEVGKGTGLGLSTVYGIVKGHKGRISCASSPGQGSSFKIYLPAIQEEEKIDSIREAAPETLSVKGNETILFVDDEPMILDIAQEMLEGKGYSMLQARSGEEALEIFKGSGDAIALVVMDLGMPGMGGEKCIQKLLEIDPKLRVVVASGYVAHSVMENPQPHGALAAVGKPYRLNELLQTIRAVLDHE